MADNPIVKKYLATMEVLRQAASKDKAPELDRIHWGLLREAAIFEIPYGLYASLYHAADHYTTEVLGGLPWRDPDLPDAPPEQETTHLLQRVREEAKRITLPENLPFPICYLGYEPAVPLTDPQRDLFGLPPVDCKLYAHLVDQRGNVISFILGVDIQTGYRKVHIYPERWSKKGEGWIWQEPMTLAPWIVPTVLDWINDHKKVIEDKTLLFSYRSAFKSAAKRRGIKAPIPPPYYTIYLKDVRIEETAREVFGRRFKKVIDWQHRWQVRGHDCLRIRRGPLPLDPKLEAKLRKRKYKVFTLEKPDFEIYHALALRGVQPKRVDEWMAVLCYWQSPCVKGPPDKPLIPGVRKSTRKRLVTCS